MDKHTPEQRSYNMSQVKSKNTKPEKVLMKALKDKRIYFTHHRTDIFGKPDITFIRKKVAVFIDSDFWHGKAKLPETNKEFWGNKIGRNVERDKDVTEKLQRQGWTVLRFSVDNVKKQTEDCVQKIIISIGKSFLLKTDN